MSFNQSKSDNSNAVYRKSGRSACYNQQGGSSGTYVKGGGGGPAPSSVTSASALSSTAKSSESSAAQRSTRVVPKDPTSQLPTMSSDPAAPTTPAKRDASKAFSFQFGSISPGFMNGMAIPARTSPAPPNIDEQKRDQAHHDSFRSVPSVPTPPVPKQLQPPRKDAGVTDKSNAVETHIGTKAKKDPQVSASTPASQVQKPSVVPVTGISMPMSYHQSQASLQFGGPSPQIQSQGMSTTSLQMPIPIGNAAQVQQQVFVPGLQSCPMHPQGIMHQGQNMSFTQMGHQLSHQLGNMGIGISPINYYSSNSYNTSSLYYPPPSSLPLTSSQITPNSQPPKFNYPVYHSPQNVGFMNSSSLDSLPVNKASAAITGIVEPPNSEYSRDVPNLKPNKVKTTSKGKKKRREILQKADAGGSTSDLYNACKGPEEKKEAVLSSESTESASTSGSLKQLPADADQPDVIASERYGQSKAEPDEWEDAADMSTPKLEVADKSQLVSDVSGGIAKRCSQHSLWKFAKQCTDLLEGFEITADIAEALMSANISSSRVIGCDSHPSPGRIVYRLDGICRMDGQGSGMIEGDRCSKVSSAFHSGRGLDGIGVNAGFQSGQGGNFGILRNPRAQTRPQYFGGILSGRMQSVGNQGGIQRSSPDGERWQHHASFQQRGLIPSPTPQTPLQMMHKAEKKHEVCKVADVEEVKQKLLKAILNKLTPQNHERLLEQVKALNIDNAVTLTGVVSQFYEKAVMEPTFCEVCANLCLHLAAELPDFSEDNEKITLKRLLLNKCQQEFERGEREQEEANKADEGEVKQSDEEREERRIKARRRMLGNIGLIGELYKKRMLTERIMHECIKKLLGQYQHPAEEDVEALCKLMSTIGEMIDHPKAKELMDAYFERMKLFSNNMNLSSRARFMLKDAIDLRNNKWQQRKKVAGPEKIEEVHTDAVQERHAQAGKAGSWSGQSARRIPMDFGSRGSIMLSSPTAQMGGLRGLPTQVREYGSQDAIMH